MPDSPRDIQSREEVHKNERSDAVTPPQKEGSSETSQQQPSQSFSSSVGYLSNRWNPASSFSTPSTLDRRGDDSFKSVTK